MCNICKHKNSTSIGVSKCILCEMCISFFFFRLVPKLYYPIDHQNKDPITAIAKEDIDIYLDIAHKGALHSTLPLVHALVKPFSVHNSSFNPIVDASLSRVINLLVTKLRMCSNKHLIVRFHSNFF